MLGVVASSIWFFSSTLEVVAAVSHFVAESLSSSESVFVVRSSSLRKDTNSLA